MRASGHRGEEIGNGHGLDFALWMCLLRGVRGRLLARRRARGEDGVKLTQLGLEAEQLAVVRSLYDLSHGAKISIITSAISRAQRLYLLTCISPRHANMASRNALSCSSSTKSIKFFVPSPSGLKTGSTVVFLSMLAVLSSL